MTDNAKRTGAALAAHFQFLLWLTPALERSPKAHKFTLGDRIQNQALDVLEALIEATYTRDCAEHLRRANLERLRGRCGGVGAHRREHWRQHGLAAIKAIPGATHRCRDMAARVLTTATPDCYTTPTKPAHQPHIFQRVTAATRTFQSSLAAPA